MLRRGVACVLVDVGGIGGQDQSTHHLRRFDCHLLSNGATRRQAFHCSRSPLHLLDCPEQVLCMLLSTVAGRYRLAATEGEHAKPWTPFGVPPVQEGVGTHSIDHL